MKAVYDGDSGDARAKLLPVVMQIVDMLDGLALALDLAAARTGADVDNGDKAQDAMQRYNMDFHRYRDRLLRSKEYVKASRYDKTVRTVWEASLASLRGIEEHDPDIRPIELLALLALLDRTNIQTELF
ncbi:hypothetical protein LTR56_023068 [Elasticomyces elasticus]|nr:hypothetical protein LTR56_023068 [Elasticomyces elasticus]KAK3623345.1 hypothetical protein LTR22_024424 [Elasticomyces elasticus]KAK4907293.1 hypothetical protein LTR49_023663 [Elasticomyces elasticus]KAK5747771.1 hypothetical protein LTS12_022170 [Elasticomyces elasticus]